ncbi:hypothetical protein HK096_001771, partial [Nowakowskiella sp. JEL0078]
GHSSLVYSVAFSPDGGTVVSGSDDYTIRLWDIKSGSSKVLEGHSGGVNSVAFSADGGTVTSTDLSGISKLWNVKSGLEITTSSEFHQQKNQQKSNMLIDKDGWIHRNGIRILWLPMSLRGHKVSEHEWIIAIGNTQGR